MASASFIAGDWGTSHLRLYLCDATGRVLERRAGPGVARLAGDFPGALAAAAGHWLTSGVELPVVLCGMVGSSICWVNVPYLPCPLPLDEIAAGSARPRPAVCIAPGVSCVNVHGAPDVLRGEETQVLGALHLDPDLRSGRHLLCLPGTHSKWVIVNNGVLREFMTAVTGELFALIRDHSVLLRPGSAGGSGSRTGAFDRAVKHVAAQRQASILQMLFECRSRQLAGDLSAQDAPAYLSGLLIADEVSASLAGLGTRLAAISRVLLIGEPALTGPYAAVLATHRVDARQLDGAAASLAGLARIHAQLFAGEAHV